MVLPAGLPAGEAIAMSSPGGRRYSGVCPGFAIKAVLRRGQIDRVGTLARAVAARQEEVAERAKLGAGAPPD
jgi:hypothetical protein